MVYDYGQERIQFEEEEDNNIAGYNEEDDDAYYDNNDQIQNQNQIQTQQEEEFGRKQTLNHNSSSDDSSQGKLFVGGISWDTTEETFTRYFSKFGEIADSVIMKDRNTGRPRGFGFITFSDAAAADRVLEEEHVLDGRTVEVKRTVPREDMELKGVVRAKKIFVGGIPATLTENELREYFSAYGNIVEHQIMVDHKSGRSRGFGFVTFETEDSVEKIFSTGRVHELGGKRVEIKKAVPKRGIDNNSIVKSHNGHNNGGGGYGGGHSSGDYYGGKMGRGYNAYGGYGGYGGYGAGYGATNGFYGGYGGYGYGFGFGPMMYGGGGGYSGNGYGASGAYGNGASSAYGNGTPGAYGNSGANKAYGRSNDNGTYNSNGKGYGSSGSANGGHGSSRGYGGSDNGNGNGGSVVSGRYHPYQK